MTVLAVIPARGGSTRIPRKNMQLVGGMTLVERAWRCAADAFGADRVMVSVDDDDEILDHVKSWGKHADWCIRRKEARGDAPMAAVLLDAFKTSDTSADWVVCVQPTTPQRTAADLGDGLEAVAQVGNTDGSAIWDRAAVSVHDDGQHRWVRNGAFYVTTPEILKTGTVLWRTTVVETAPYIDINTPEDLARVRELMG